MPEEVSGLFSAISNFGFPISSRGSQPFLDLTGLKPTRYPQTSLSAECRRGGKSSKVRAILDQPARAYTITLPPLPRRRSHSGGGTTFSTIIPPAHPRLSHSAAITSSPLSSFFPLPQGLGLDTLSNAITVISESAPARSNSHMAPFLTLLHSFLRIFTQVGPLTDIHSFNRLIAFDTLPLIPNITTA